MMVFSGVVRLVTDFEQKIDNMSLTYTLDLPPRRNSGKTNLYMPRGVGPPYTKHYPTACITGSLSPRWPAERVDSALIQPPHLAVCWCPIG